MAESLKVQLKGLALQREDMEGDISLRSARLDAAGVGLHGSLVDSEVAPLICSPAQEMYRRMVIPHGTCYSCKHLCRDTQGQTWMSCPSGQTGTG